jgi:hypothetical protein
MMAFTLNLDPPVIPCGHFAQQQRRAFAFFARGGLSTFGVTR